MVRVATVRPELARQAPLASIALSPWQAAAVRLAAVWLGLIAAFARDWQAMAAQWWNSSTYSHILLVPVISAWLLWQRRAAVAQVPPRAAWIGVPALAVAVLGWVLGSFAGFDLLRQAGAVAMLPASALLLLGPQACVALLFPLAYLGFLMPFGDELVPPLQTITAKLTIALVQLSGVPAVIDGVFIDTPAGLFEVAEACSGVKFLIAMIALGALVAHLGFRSAARRAGFLAACVVVPVLGNAVRAWGTIFAAQYVGIERAAGIDHLIYGWIFFAVVIAMVVGLGWRWFDRGLDQPALDPSAVLANRRMARWAGRGLSPAAALALTAAVVLLGQTWSATALAARAPVPPQLFLPPVPGWQRSDFAPAAPWQPLAQGAEHRLLGSYTDPAGRKVDVFYALYAVQADGAEAGSFGQGALVPGGDWSWSRPHPAPWAGKGDVLVYRGQHERVAQTWYRTGALLTGSNARLKLANIIDRLLLRPRTTAVLIVSAERGLGGDSAASLAAFHRALGPPGPWMDRVASAR